MKSWCLLFWNKTLEFYSYISVHENHRTCRTFLMARPKCLMRDFTNLNRIYKAHRANVWWTMKVFQIHCYMYLHACLWALACSLNSLRPSDTIWWQWTGSTLAQVMAWCLTAPSHYLNQCWLIIHKVQSHSLKGNFIRNTSATNHYN